MEHPTVIGVLNVAKDILQQNKNLDVETLYRISKRTLKIPRKGLLKIIDFLLNKKVLIEGSRFTKKSVLSNPNRKLIYDFINQNIGAHFSFIRKEIFADDESAAVGNGQLIWHLEMLLKFGHIKKIKIKNNTIFIPINVSEENAKLHYFLRDEINREIVWLILENKSMEVVNIHKHLKRNRQKVYYRINNLIDGKILALMNSDDKIISINPLYKEPIEKILTISYQKSIKEEYQERWH
ncbi:MAG: hypothetical protein ACFFAS_06685 [Promethearchaeota archaeon]